MEFPKIETVFVRDEDTRKVIPNKLRLPEFALINRWLVTEKIDGTNIRVHLHVDGTVTYGGRTDDAQLYAPLVVWLQTHLPAGVVDPAFDPGTEAILFGEGYGPKIQKGGVYRKDVSFRLFDVAVLTPARVWWLDWTNVVDVAGKCGISTVPVLAPSLEFAAAISLVQYPSAVSEQEGGLAGTIHEGIVCRTNPLLFSRGGQRVIWKLKGRDL